MGYFQCVSELAFILLPCGLIDHQTRCFDFSSYLCDHVLVHLEPTNGFTELLSFLAVICHNIETCLGQPNAPGGSRKPRLV